MGEHIGLPIKVKYIINFFQLLNYIMRKTFLYLFLGCFSIVAAQTEPVDYVNPFIGTTNYGTTNPGAMCPQSFMSVTPFNVMGSDLNKRDKDL